MVIVGGQSSKQCNDLFVLWFRIFSKNWNVISETYCCRNAPINRLAGVSDVYTTLSYIIHNSIWGSDEIITWFIYFCRIAIPNWRLEARGVARNLTPFSEGDWQSIRYLQFPPRYRKCTNFKHKLWPKLLSNRRLTSNSSKTWSLSCW